MLLLMKSGNDQFVFQADKIEERNTASRTLLIPWWRGEKYGEVDLSVADVTILPDPR